MRGLWKAVAGSLRDDEVLTSRQLVRKASGVFRTTASQPDSTEYQHHIGPKWAGIELTASGPD
ncbi:MAG: hypothetical protein QOE92_490 [Chloroflexota bacterium]|nr:hypothetical protein [Chloroflexota bacterium]